MNIADQLLMELWKFARGDTPVQYFEQWLYSSPQLEAALGNHLYMVAIETNFENSAAVFQLKKDLFAFASAQDQNECLCVRHPNLTVVDMGEHEDFFSTLKTIRERGKPFWWLFAAKCKNCGQSWLVAAEERHNDIYILRRLCSNELASIESGKSWPSDFDRYETLLLLGREASRAVRFVNPLTSSLRYTVEDLGKARPGIRVSELAQLLNISVELAEVLARQVVEAHNLKIEFDSEASYE